MSLIESGPSGKVKKTIKLWHLDTDYLKSWIHGRISWPAGEPGAWHLHQDTEEDYCKQIVAEELLVRSSGRRVWIVKNRDNHYLDAEVNALAAAMTLQVHALRRAPEAPADPEDPVPAPSPPARRSNPFVRGWRP
jgi:phage terminase large subunit GpA-like protein